MGVHLLEDKILKWKWYPSGHLQTRPFFQIVTPDLIKKRVLTALHNSPTGGHLGDFKTLVKVRQWLYWVGYKGDILHWCRQCGIFAQSEPGVHFTKPSHALRGVADPSQKITIVLQSAHISAINRIYMVKPRPKWPTHKNVTVLNLEGIMAVIIIVTSANTFLGILPKIFYPSVADIGIFRENSVTVEAMPSCIANPSAVMEIMCTMLCVNFSVVNRAPSCGHS